MPTMPMSTKAVGSPPSPGSIPGISGHRTPTHRFRISSSDRAIDGDALQDLLHGGAVAHVVRRYLDAEEADRLASAFDMTVSRQREDDVPALTAGASHFAKTMPGYLAELRRTRPEMQLIYGAAGVDLDTLTDWDIKRCLDDGQAIRNARYKACDAMPVRAAAWIGVSGSDVALDAHEDEQQLRDPKQRGFEIQQVQTPVAMNIYARVPDTGGALRVWAIQPSQLCKDQLGVSGRGYPYPVELLEDVQWVDIKPEAGDLVLLNGRYLHAVMGWSGRTCDRIVFNGFIGLSQDGCTVMRWS